MKYTVVLAPPKDVLRHRAEESGLAEPDIDSYVATGVEARNVVEAIRKAKLEAWRHCTNEERAFASNKAWRFLVVFEGTPRVASIA